MSEETLEEKAIRLATAPKSLRKVLINEQTTEEARISAAIEIQRIARGYIVRNLGPRAYQAWRDESTFTLPVDVNSLSSVRFVESNRRTGHHNPSPTSEHRAKLKPSLTTTEAATKIQRCWRRHIDMQVYKYYEDLIKFRNQGDPALMLKAVNPKEAALLDAASGTHVKFRLAGDRFPPNIYYKIYTHRPIQDLCANAPRDYTKSGKQKDMRGQHNKNYSSLNTSLESTEDWYKRIENNGWRLVSDRLIPHMLSDPVTWATHNKVLPTFQHSKMLRIQDVEKLRKKRKIDWMKKLYKEGMLKAKTADPDTMALVEGATTGMVATLELEGEEAVAEWEVDELLDWTTSLNFEDYVTSWKQVGTSSLSETTVEKRYFFTSNSKTGDHRNTESLPVNKVVQEHIKPSTAEGTVR